MPDFDRIQRVGQPGSEWAEHGSFEAEQFFTQAEEWPVGPTGEAFGEAERLEFASELLEVTSDAELDGVLRDLIGRAGQAAGKLISSPEGNAIGSVLKGAAKRVLSGIGGDTPQSAGREFGLELEGLSNEDREFEIARHYVDFASEALRNLASQHRFLHPEEAADAAVVEAAKTHAPGPLSRGAGSHSFSATISASPLAESEFDVSPSDYTTIERDDPLKVYVRPKPISLRFMNLDDFDWNSWVLTQALTQKIELLANEVKLSWTTIYPIGYVILIGHTDNTGSEAYNRDLGRKRAEEVQKCLWRLLKGEILNRGVKMLVEQSPGSSSPVADNRTVSGRALNRRVEVFIAPPPPPPPGKPILRPPPPPPPPPGNDIEKRVNDLLQKKIPTLPPGRSPRDFIDEQLKKIGIPSGLSSKLSDAAVRGVVSEALNSAHVSVDQRDAILNVLLGIYETKAQ